LNAWMSARETALARVRALPDAPLAEVRAFRDALAEARQNADPWHSEHPAQVAKLADLRSDLARLAGHIEAGWNQQAPQPWNALWLWGEAQLSEEGQECLLALMLEPHGAIVDELEDRLDADETARFAIDGAMTVGRLRALIAEDYGWTGRFDFADPAQSARFWYVSEEKLEPRLGDRRAEAGQEREQPLGIARDVSALSSALAGWPDSEGLARFLLARPEHRHTVRRIQMLHGLTYAEIRDNLLDAGMLPIDILRCKLAFFGATRFDPRSDRWVRISLFQDMPYPDEIGT
jgi:hypothetical protein